MADADFELETAMTLDSKKFKDGLKRTEKDAEKSGKKIEKTIADSGEQGFSKFTKFAADAVTKMGLLELKIKGINALTDVFNGDMKSAAETIKQLPAGIGPVAQGLEVMLGNITGITKELKMIEQETRIIGGSIAIQTAINDRRTSARDRLSLQLRQLRQEREVQQAPESERQAIIDRHAKENRILATKLSIKQAVSSVRPSEPESKTLAENEDRISELSQMIERQRKLVANIPQAGIGEEVAAGGLSLARGRALSKIEEMEKERGQLVSASRGIRSRSEEASTELKTLGQQILQTLKQIQTQADPNKTGVLN